MGSHRHARQQDAHDERPGDEEDVQAARSGRSKKDVDNDDDADRDDIMHGSGQEQSKFGADMVHPV